MISRSSDSKLWTYLRRSLRRTAITGQVTTQGLGTLLTDYRLLARRWNNGVVFRQKRMGGFQMLVRADEDVGRQIFCCGTFEPEESRYLRENIREADTCVDVGANVGYYTLLLASLAGTGEVHSFEPVLLNYHLLSSNVLVNRFENVVANCCALGDSEGEEEFIVAQDSAYSSLVDTGRKPMFARTRVRMTTLDHYCHQHGIGRVDFIKVDVEGAEERVLCGAAKLLGDQSRRPRLIMLELYEPMLRKHRSGIDSILERVRGYGYRPFVRHKGSTLSFTKQHYSTFSNIFFSSGYSS